MSNFYLIIPEATENLFTNPSFENDLTGWTQAGTWTTVTTDQWMGAKAAKCTALSGGEASILASLGLSATTHTIQAMVKRSSGGVVDNTISKIRRGGSSVNWDSFTHIHDGWYHCTGTLPLAAPTIGLFVFEADILVDALQVEEKAYWTTYCDGDLVGHRDRLSTAARPLTGYAWTGDPHASTSTRHAHERSGGREWDLEDLGVHVVGGWTGWGPPTPQHTVIPYAVGDGAFHQGVKIPARSLDIALTFRGDSGDLENLHSDRLGVQDGTRVKLVKPVQPFTLRYKVGNTPKWLELDGYYGGGFEGSTPSKTVEKAALRIIVPDPFWRRLRRRAVELTVNSPTAITNGGKEEAFPTLIIEGEGSIDSLTNNDTGDVITFNLFVQPGERIIFDLANRTLISSTRGRIRSAIVRGSDIGTWSLEEGSSSITLAASSTGSLSTLSGNNLVTLSGDSLIIGSTLDITKAQLEFPERFETADGVAA